MSRVDALRAAAGLGIALVAASCEGFFVSELYDVRVPFLPLALASGVLEELVFRGVLFRAMTLAWSVTAAGISNLAVVGILHWDGSIVGLTLLPRILFIQLVCILLYGWSGRTLPGAIFHVAFNFSMLLRYS